MHRLRFLTILLVLLASACQPQPTSNNPASSTFITSSHPFTETPSLALDTSTPGTDTPDTGTHLLPPTLIPSSPPPTSTPNQPPETVTHGTGTLAAPLPPSTSPLISLLFTGVIVPARCVQAAIDERGSADYIFDEVRGVISDADLAVGTLNATISDHPPHTGCVPTYVLVGGAGNADALQRAGFDVMSVATNHIKNCGLMDCGDRAFFDTLDNLRRTGILPVGAGADHAEAMQPVVVELDGVRFGIVSLGQIEPMAFAGQDKPGIAVLNEQNLREAVDAARQVSDVVIAMPHWGPEDVPWPNHIQRELARQLVEAGADLVVGNHTHVVQALQDIDGVPVFYGLGNFVFDQGLRDHQQGVILKVYFDGERFAGYDLIPTHVDRDGTVHIAEAEESAEVLERTASASQELGSNAALDYLPSMTLEEAAGLERDEIFHHLFEDWLTYYSSPVVTNTARISDFEIHNFKLDDYLGEAAAGWGAESGAEVNYSVRPIVPRFTRWAAGSGELTPDGWVREKRAVVGLKQDGGRYWMKVLASD